MQFLKNHIFTYLFQYREDNSHYCKHKHHSNAAVLYFNSHVVSVKINKTFSGNKLLSWYLLLFIERYNIAQESVVCVLSA